MRSHLVTVIAVLLALLAVLPDVDGTGAAQTRPLPPGHPPTGEPGGTPSIPGPPAGSGAHSQGLTWKTPAGWTEETPASSMRRVQYRIPGPGGPAECVVFYFGPGQGGDAQANAARWASQFHRADGGPVGDAFKTREIKVGDIRVVLVEVAGTYGADGDCTVMLSMTCGASLYLMTVPGLISLASIGKGRELRDKSREPE